jgi:DNA primase
MARIDWAAVKAGHSLASVARRTGLDVPVAGGVMVCCPMPDHDDHTPSMHLDLDKNLYRCYGCDVHGDVVQWVRDLEDVKAGDAVAILDSGRPIAGVLADGAVRSSEPLVEREKPDLDRTPPIRVEAANAAAWGYYTYRALHEYGVAYLAHRGIDVSALEAELGRPVVGHTPSAKTRIDGLVTRLWTKGFTDDEMVDAGLATRNPDGSIIDFFRDRAIFPVTDDSGRVVGLLGRDVTDRSPVKYLNQAHTHTYDKSIAFYRPSTPQLDNHASVVVCEGPLDALAVATQAATAGKSAWFAPVAASGRALSNGQMDRILAIHGRAPIFAADGDKPGREANLDWAAKAVLRGRESVVVNWPDGEDPASWLAARGEDGLCAMTRRGSLAGAPTELRPHHCGAFLTRVALDGLPADGDRSAALARIVDEVRTVSDRLGANARERYAAAAAEVLAPVAVHIGIEAGQGGEVIAIIEQLALYGARLPVAGQTIFAERAAFAMESRDLGAAGWVERRLAAAMEPDNWAGEAHGKVAGDNTTTSVSMSPNVELTV